MDRATGDIVKKAGLAAGLIGVAVGAVIAFKRVRCPCDGAFLPFLGDKNALGTRYCKTCRHNH